MTNRKPLFHSGEWADLDWEKNDGSFDEDAGLAFPNKQPNRIRIPDHELASGVYGDDAFCNTYVEMFDGIERLDSTVEADEIMAEMSREAIDRDISELEAELSARNLDDDLMKMVYHQVATFDEAVRAQKIRNENSD